MPDTTAEITQFCSVCGTIQKQTYKFWVLKCDQRQQTLEDFILRAGDLAQWCCHLPHKHKIPNLIPSIKKKKIHFEIAPIFYGDLAWEMTEI